jgi:hypothetical protein
MVDMQTPVADEPGPDITVYEGDTSPEGYEVYALTNMDGDWNYIGSGTGTFNFDLATAGISGAQYFVILDDDNGTANVNDAGFDFDAIANIHAPIPDTLAHLSGKVFDSNTGLPLNGVQIILADTTIVTDTAGFYSINPIRGSYSICASIQNYNTECDTLLLAPGEAFTHDFYLDFNVGLPKPNHTASFAARPNPFSNRLNIHFNNKTEGRVKIYLSPLAGGGSITLTDKVFPAGEVQFTTVPAEFSGYKLSPGIYILSIETSTYKQVSKVIKVSEL